ncbi:MAG: ATP-dependent DNA helicase RecG [Planctomycetota bacterium]
MAGRSDATQQDEPKRGRGLTSRLADVRGISKNRAEDLARLGLTNVGRLLAHLPSRHEWLEPESGLEGVEADANVSIIGEVTACRPVTYGRPRFEAVLSDGEHRVELVWFNQVWLRNKIHAGVRLRVQGRTKSRGGTVQIANAKWEVLKPEEDDPAPTRTQRTLRAIYPAGDGVTTDEIAEAMGKIVPWAPALIEDHLPDAYRREKAMPTLADAYRMQHRPESDAEVAESQRRLAFDELLLLQLGVHLKRAERRATLKAPKLDATEAIDAHIRERLPHTLTEQQDKVVREICADLAKPTPANRLIQGDVGSGKTLVAVYAMLLAVATGSQGALMAPTEILAEQHFASIRELLSGSRVSVELLTGGVTGEARDSLLRRLASGGVDLVIGTHALLTESVRFKDLAIAVIDEQHRFGVHQRAALREKMDEPNSSPHVLVMTATPIPRTLAITVFGDLDVSTIDGLPPGRQPVHTRSVRTEQRDDVYAWVRARVEAGDQAYVVAPGIDAEGVTGVRRLVKELGEGPLEGLRVAALHGKLTRTTRERVMGRFRTGQIDVMVATTVIEVGVDVANATVMVVEDADRFGLAQLHQLRGRVGRGQKKSACVLIAGPTPTEVGERRREIMAAVSDGFVLAERDRELRGPGEIFGARQSGLPPFKVADLMRDRELLAMARRDAAAWVERSPKLALDEEITLRRRLLKAYGEALQLADVG